MTKHLSKANQLYAAQAERVARLFVIAFVGQVLTQLTASGDVTHLGRKAIVGLIIGAAEAAYRTVVPVVRANVVSDVTTVTPAQPQTSDATEDAASASPSPLSSAP